MIAWSRRILEIQPLLLSISWCNCFAKELKDQIDKRRREDRLGLSLYCVFCWWSRWRTWKKSGNQTLPELLIQLCYRKRCQENDGSAEEAGQIYLKVESHQSVVIQKWAVVQAVVMAMFFRNGEKRWVWSLEREFDPHLRKLKNVESWSMGWTVRFFLMTAFMLRGHWRSTWALPCDQQSCGGLVRWKWSLSLPAKNVDETRLFDDWGLVTKKTCQYMWHFSY